MNSRRTIILISSTIIMAVVVSIGLNARKLKKGRGTMPVPISPTQKIEITSTAQVEITENGFIPKTLTVKKNALVTFVNKDSELHTISSDPYPTNDLLPEFNSQTHVQPEGSYSFLFDTVGTYTYHDDFNPFDLQGTVIVEN